MTDSQNQPARRVWRQPEDLLRLHRARCRVQSRIFNRACGCRVTGSTLLQEAGGRLDNWQPTRCIIDKYANIDRLVDPAQRIPDVLVPPILEVIKPAIYAKALVPVVVHPKDRRWSTSRERKDERVLHRRADLAREIDELDEVDQGRPRRERPRRTGAGTRAPTTATASGSASTSKNRRDFGLVARNRARSGCSGGRELPDAGAGAGREAASTAATSTPG